MFELVTEAEALVYLQRTSMTEDLAQLITNISARIEAYTGRWFIARPVVDILDSDGRDVLFLSRYPVQGAPTVTDLTTNTPITDFLTYSGSGYLYREGGWPAGRQRYRVEYQAGICQDVATVPADVKQACLEWVKARFERRDPAITREQLGDYSYSANEPDGIPAGVKAALSLWRVPRG